MTEPEIDMQNGHDQVNTAGQQHVDVEFHSFIYV